MVSDAFQARSGQAFAQKAGNTLNSKLMRFHEKMGRRLKTVCYRQEF